jgi:hypothetical protein
LWLWAQIADEKRSFAERRLVGEPVGALIARLSFPSLRNPSPARPSPYPALVTIGCARPGSQASSSGHWNQGDPRGSGRLWLR